MAVDERLLHGSSGRGDECRTARRTEKRGCLSAENGDLHRTVRGVSFGTGLASGFRHAAKGRKTAEGAGGVFDVVRSYRSSGVGSSGVGSSGVGSSGGDPRRTAEREPLHDGGVESPHRPQNPLHLRARSGTAEPRRRAASRANQGLERGAARRLQPNPIPVSAQARRAASRRDVERQDGNLHPPHPKGSRRRPSGALSAARNRADGADDGATAPCFRPSTGHLSFEIQRCRARGNLAKTALRRALRRDSRGSLGGVSALSAAWTGHCR